MYSLLTGIQSQLTRQEIKIDNVIFRLHCTFSAVLLIVFSLVVGYTQLIGQPIRCVPNKEGMHNHFLNLYCWVTPTFTVPDTLGRPTSGDLFPGISASRFNHEDYASTHHRYHSYYQWVSFVLLLQAALFYFPKWLWISWEQGFLKEMVKDLKVKLRLEDDTQEKKEQLVDYLANNQNEFQRYAFRYWFCESLCFVNVIGQMILLNWFFQYDFLSLGVHALTLDSQNPDDRTDHLITVFPRVTKCTFQKFGHSGSREIMDALCYLPINVVNEKVFIFLWFWLIILAVMTASLTVLRLVTVFVPSVRKYLMQMRFPLVGRKEVGLVVRGATTNNWWVLYMLGVNMDPHIYSQVITKYSQTLAGSRTRENRRSGLYKES